MDVKFDDCRTAKSNDPSRSIVVDDYSVHDEPVKPVVITDKLAATITPLDNTWIHPEQYGAAYSLIEASGTALKMFGSEEFRERIKTFCAGVDGNALAAQLRVDSQTLKLIVDGLTLSLGILCGIFVQTFLRYFCWRFVCVFGRFCAKNRDMGVWLCLIAPVFLLVSGYVDIRDRMEVPFYRQHGPIALASLSPGVSLRGQVRNVTSFGVFVDIGVGHDGLIHSRYLGGMEEGLEIGQTLNVKVVSISQQQSGGKPRISLQLSSEENE